MRTLARRARYTRANPWTPERKIALGAGLVGATFLGYYLYKKSPAAVTVQAVAGQYATATIGAGGTATFLAPAGATSVTATGGSTPVTTLPTGASVTGLASGATATLSLTWQDASAGAQAATLTVTSK